jgi:integrating conjugative element protein (TIGR03757 family)
MSEFRFLAAVSQGIDSNPPKCQGTPLGRSFGPEGTPHPYPPNSDMRILCPSLTPTPFSSTLVRHTLSRSRLAVSAACVLGFANQVNATEIWVVTDHAHPMVQSDRVRVIQIDAVAKIEAELNARLPNNERGASAMVRQRLSDGGADLRHRLIVAYQGITDAWSLGITKVPAVVVDRSFVVYGTLNLELAVSLIEQYRSAHP